MGQKKHALFSIKVQKVKFFLFLVTKVFSNKKNQVRKALNAPKIFYKIFIAFMVRFPLTGRYM